MICAKPFKRGVLEFGCGQCMPCRINRRRLWTARLVLESTQHEASYFVTLTYDKEHVPDDMSLRPVDFQLWLKRLRRFNEPNLVRFFGVGEYGEIGGRPHYHAAIFGNVVRASLESEWKYGFVHVGLLTRQSASYMVGYVTKGMTGKSDARLNGRHPEFARMSRKPGIGAGAMKEVASHVMSGRLSRYIEETGDVPRAVRWDGKVWPVGRYLANQVRLLAGWQSGVPEVLLERHAREKQVELSVEGAVELLEAKRVQVEQNAIARNRLAKSKRRSL